MKSITWGFGFIAPCLLILLGLYSIVFQESIIPLTQGAGRFSIGGTPARGVTAILMGITFLGFASLLVGTCFDPLRKKYDGVAVGLQIAGFLTAFLLLAYILIIRR